MLPLSLLFIQRRFVYSRHYRINVRSIVTPRILLYGIQKSTHCAAIYEQLLQLTSGHISKFVPRMGFEPTIPAFEPVKTIHDLDRAATVFG
jgi:hypothetical protein